jgi:hypothetical protein
MRALLVLVLMVSAVGCRCSPANPQPVTLRVVNPTRDPIFVDLTDGRLGLSVQREVGGQWFSFDDLACECRSCARECDATCTCPDAGSPRVLRIDPGGKAERGWDGVVQVSGFARCQPAGCLEQVNAPLNEPFQLELCFSAQRPSGVRFEDGGVGEGQLPRVSLTCTTKRFTVSDLEVEIAPPRGAACTTTADCRGEGELCFDGACTSGCPPNDFPEVGSAWNLLVPSPDNMGFFERFAQTTGFRLTGAGTLTSVQFQGSTLQLALSRPGPVQGEVLTGRVQVQLPPGFGPPLAPNTPVKVSVYDRGGMLPNRAVVVRHDVTNELLFVADMGQGARLLPAAELQPFTVSDAPAPVGCQQSACGRFLVTPVRFGAGTSTVEVLPGRTGTVSAAGGTWQLLNVTNGAWAMTSCSVTELRPYAFWKLQPGP